ncbi:MgtC/SapB family protein [Flectobacillus major]|jgi:putative Mg2+ transporter-C (MgtC) family protein|uniref:MgtC/SapB family protein n=1 Tax=Flectobacillus major TaxID=103 RepID=UPI0003FBD3C9|nr:MgtC/SapB family protein [Flectobacillus major]
MSDIEILWNHITRNEDLIKLIASIIVGAIIGGEREYHSKSAGLRTFTLICVGSTIFTILSEKVGQGVSPDRISANIVTGVGFLGAGIIFKVDDRVKGLTTAAIIWVTAALGMAIGDGHILLSFLGAIFVFGILQFFITLEKWIHKYGETRNYRIVMRRTHEGFPKLEEFFRQNHMQAKKGKQVFREGIFICYWSVRGQTSKHERLAKRLLSDERIIELEY